MGVSSLRDRCVIQNRCQMLLKFGQRTGHSLVLTWQEADSTAWQACVRACDGVRLMSPGQDGSCSGGAVVVADVDEVSCIVPGATLPR